jgi:hypothetical protein
MTRRFRVFALFALDPGFAAARRARVDVMAVRARLRRPLFEESYLTMTDIARLWALLAPGPWDGNRSHSEARRRDGLLRPLVSGVCEA